MTQIGSDGDGPGGRGSAGAEPTGELMTASRIRRLLEAHGLAPSKRRGQNFVVDANTVRKVVRDAGVRAGDRVVEVGPGVGSLTLALRAAGAHVVAVEIDRGLAAALADVVDGGVRIIHADALSIDYRAIVDRPALLVANLPYNVATPLVITALESGCFSGLHVMVQREVGERWCADVGHTRYGAVSIKIAALATARIVATVSRTAFWPVPGVDSVTVSLLPHADMLPAQDRRALFDLVEAGFSQRRKRLRNALAAAGWSPEDTEAALRSIGRPVGARAEELTLQDWIALRRALIAGS